MIHNSNYKKPCYFGWKKQSFTQFHFRFPKSLKEKKLSVNKKTVKCSLITNKTTMKIKFQLKTKSFEVFFAENYLFCLIWL